MQIKITHVSLKGWKKKKTGRLMKYLVGGRNAVCGTAERGEVKAASLCRVLPVTNHCAARLREKKIKQRRWLRKKCGDFFLGWTVWQLPALQGLMLETGYFPRIGPWIDNILRCLLPICCCYGITVKRRCRLGSWAFNCRQILLFLLDVCCKWS